MARYRLRLMFNRVQSLLLLKVCRQVEIYGFDSELHPEPEDTFLNCST